MTIESFDWLIDVGFGYPSFYLPLKLESMVSQKQTTGLFRVRQVEMGGTEYFLEKHKKEIRDMDSMLNFSFSFNL